MAVNPISTTRVTHNLRTLTLEQQLASNSLRIFGLQQQLATGRRLISAHDDPVGTGRAIRYQQILDRQDQILANIRNADSYLAATDSAISDISDLLIQATSIASEQLNSFQSPEQRAASATIVDGIISQLQIVGNRQFQGRFLFAGRDVGRPPLDSALGRIRNSGDGGDLTTRVATGSSLGFDAALAYNLTVDQLYQLGKNVIRSSADLNPQLSGATRLTDLNGALGKGVRLGTVRFTEHTGGGIVFDVDFSGVETIDDLLARFNAAAASAGTSLSLSAVGNHLRIVSGGGFNVSVADIGDGFAAADLGLAVSGGPSTFDGGDVDPRLTLTTRLSDLLNGAGLTLPNGVSITNGSLAANVSFTGVTTIQEVLNRLNSAGVGIRASINAAGNGLDVLNLVSGLELRIGENGGLDATRLGIRSLNAGTSLSELNQGRGVTTVAGDDLTITDANGIQFGVDLDGATTMTDVIARINTAAGVAGSTLTAGLATTGNGLRLSQPAGATAIRVDRANLSAAIDDLGLSGVTGTTSEFVGTDVNPNRASGVLSALYELRDALLANDTKKITSAGAALSDLQRHVASVQGQVGARSAAAQQRLSRTQDAVDSTKVLLSEVMDVDYTEAITKFQQAQTALQANLLAGSKLIDLSLLDFLR